MEADIIVAWVGETHMLIILVRVKRAQVKETQENSNIGKVGSLSPRGPRDCLMLHPPFLGGRPGHTVEGVHPGQT